MPTAAPAPTLAAVHAPTLASTTTASSFLSPTTPVVIISIALLLSSGVLLRTLQPKLRARGGGTAAGAGTGAAAAATNASKGGKKRKESVLKSIIDAQAADAANPSTGPAGARSRATSVVDALPAGAGAARGRSPAASASPANERLGTPGPGPDPGPLLSPVASGSRSLPPVASTLGPPPVERPGAGSRKSSYAAKGKKAKSQPLTLAPPSSTASSAAGSTSPSPAGSPRRRPPTRNASVGCTGPPTSEASVQTRPDDVLAPRFEFPPLPDSPLLPALSYPLPPFERSPPSPTFCDAHVQTSPRLMPTLRRPAMPAYDLHASFQSTPSPARPTPSSPLHSPSPSPVPTGSNPSSSTPTVRSRKQQRKAAALAVATSQHVVGLPRPPRSRDPTEESDPGESGQAQNNHITSPTAGRAARAGVSAFSATMVDSPECASMTLPTRPPSSLVKGKERERAEWSSLNVNVHQTPTQNGGAYGYGGIGNGFPPPRPNGLPMPTGTIMPNGSSGTLMPAGQGGVGSYGSIPAPIPIPPPDAAAHRRQSTHSSTSSSHPTSSNSSPYLSHLALSSVSPDKDWARRAWEHDSSRVVGLGVDVRARGESVSSREGSCEPQPPELLSPPTSPDPMPASHLPPPPLSASIPFQSMPQQQHRDGRPWSPHIMNGQYPMLPFPPHANGGPLLTSGNGHPNGNGNAFQSRPSSRQSSLSVPNLTSPRDQQLLQQQYLQQQQAYAFANAQAQYHQAIAMQLQQQQVHASQTAQRQHRLQQELQSASDGGTPTRQPSSSFQTPGSQPHPGVPSSPSMNIVHSVSPTSSTFPPGTHPYYGQSPTTPFLGTYHLSTSQGSSSQHSNANLQPTANRSASSSKGRDSRKNSPRIGGPDKGGKPSPTTVVSESTGWKVKLRTAEMEADRNGKELEIARWRLAVLEEDRTAAEVENQEALSALATRAQRAEARLKVLEEARQQDSSSASASGSCSPATRPSSVGETSDLALSRSTVDDDLVRFASPSGVAVHPLAWVDLDTVNFNTHLPPSQSRHLLSSPSPSGRTKDRRSGRFSTGPDSYVNTRRRSGNNNNRRRSTNSHNSPDPSGGLGIDEGSDDDVVIVLDTPIRRKPPRLPSRRSSFQDDDQAPSDDDDVSNVDLDVEGEEEREHLDYTGFLPTFLTTDVTGASSGGSTEVPPLLPTSPAPLNGFVSIPSFVLDCATPSPHEEVAPPLDDDDDNEQTPQLAPKTPPPPPLMAA